MSNRQVLCTILITHGEGCEVFVNIETLIAGNITIVQQARIRCEACNEWKKLVTAPTFLGTYTCRYRCDNSHTYIKIGLHCYLVTSGNALYITGCKGYQWIRQHTTVALHHLGLQDPAKAIEPG